VIGTSEEILLSYGPKYQTRVENFTGGIIGDGNRIDSLTIHEARSLGEEAAEYAATGIAHLNHRAYGDAERAFEESIERAQGSSALHYRLALARLGGRSPTELSTQRIRSIEQSLRHSLALDPLGGRPALLLAYVRYHHYVRHCRRFHGRPPIELYRLAQSQGLSRETVAEMGQHVRIDPLLRKLARACR
jgi:hypothetical protein